MNHQVILMKMMIVMKEHWCNYDYHVQQDPTTTTTIASDNVSDTTTATTTKTIHDVHVHRGIHSDWPDINLLTAKFRRFFSTPNAFFIQENMFSKPHRPLLVISVQIRIIETSASPSQFR